MEPVDVLGWVLGNNRAEGAIPALVVAPGACLVIGGNVGLQTELPDSVAFVVIEDGQIGNGMANSGDRGLLVDPSGTAVDVVLCGSDRTIARLASPPAGETLSRDARGEFAVGGASPRARSLERASVEGAPPPPRIWEIFANAGVGTQDGALEWIEIHNPTYTPVALGGWQISDTVASDVLPVAVLEAGRRS